MEPLLELKKRFGFMLMEDACSSTGSTYDGQHVGTFGDISSFSFYYGHHLSTIEGGMVCTNDETLHDILLMIRNHGWLKDLPEEKADRKVSDSNIPRANSIRYDASFSSTSSKRSRETLPSVCALLVKHGGMQPGRRCS